MSICIIITTPKILRSIAKLWKIFEHTHIYIYNLTACVAQLAKASETQAVGQDH